MLKTYPCQGGSFPPLTRQGCNIAILFKKDRKYTSQGFELFFEQKINP
jgi:hypothetical protein